MVWFGGGEEVKRLWEELGEGNHNPNILYEKSILKKRW